MKRTIYMDYAATTPLEPKVLAEMLPYLKLEYGNASSIHEPGQKAREAIDKAREQVAGFLNCSASEIIFTGSATEADNLAILGPVRSLIKSHPLPPTEPIGGSASGLSKCTNFCRASNGVKPHIITTKTEHHAIIEPCEALEKQGLAEITYLTVDKDGLIKPADVQKALKANTVLVSVMYANNEIGVIQPIAEIAEVIRNFRNPKSEIRNPKQIQSANNQNSKPRYPTFHTDAVQAINYLDCDVQKLGVDLLTLSGHKIYGPKGVGALYIRQGALIEPIIYGGGQERGMRPGTENVAAIVGLGEAIKLVQSAKPSTRAQAEGFKVQSLEKLRDKLIDGVLAKIPKSRLNGSAENRLPNNANFSFEGAEGESIVIALDQEGIAASTGSACSSRSLEPSHVLLALGLSHEQAHGSLRLTLGRYTTEQEVDRVLAVLPKIIERLRKISGRA